MSSRDINIDLLRICSCFMVIILHVSGQNWRLVNVHSMEWFVFNAYDSAVRSCVPLFFMISGYLFLSKGYMISINQLYKRNILKIIILYFVWSFLYAVFRVDFTDISFETLIYEILQSEFHLWYLPALISVYIMIPLLWCIAHYEDGKYLKYTCYLVFIMGILKMTVETVPFLPEIFNEFLTSFSLNISIYCGYFLIGYYIKMTREKWIHIKMKILLLVFFLIELLGIILTLGISWWANEPISFLYNNQTLFPAIQAIILMIIFLKFKVDSFLNHKRNIIIKISRYTLFIYLFHPFVINFLDNNLRINSLSLNEWVSVPLISMIVVIICLLFAFVLSHIPIVKKWII